MPSDRFLKGQFFDGRDARRSTEEKHSRKFLYFFPNWSISFFKRE